ncbi:MAG: hypothetical protein JW965_00340 [Bacteroidales bacterium]|nr:hypothetical protein [Bacteroidales bacterium]
MTLSNEQIEQVNLDELISNLKKEDEQYAGLSKRMQYIYWIMSLIFIFVIVIQIVGKCHVVDIIGNFCFLFAMLIFGFLFKYYYREYKYVDYSQPTLVMLKKAASRYKPFQLKTLLSVLSLLLVDAGLSLNSSLGFKFIWIQVFYLGIVVLATIIGLLVWRVRYKPIRDATLSLIREIDGENNARGFEH